jgi:hypothetical protein
MISQLLLSLLIAAPAGTVRPAVEIGDDPPIRLWINNDGRFLPGDRAKVEVRAREDGYLLVLHVDADGHLRVLFPLDPDRDNFVRGGKKYEIRGRGDRESFEIDTRSGKGTVYAAVSRDPMRFDGFVLRDHWDYRLLAPTGLPNEPEQDLNELVRRIAQSDFDYDLLNYFVTERVAYRTDYSPYYGSVYSDPSCYRFSCSSYYGSPFSVSIFFGRPYRRYYYDPYYYAYDPFYNPFFYDRYYYAPIYRPRYVYPYSRHYGYDGRYRDRFYYDRPYRSAHTPYRFRGADGFTAGFRDRRGPTHWVNTVYNPPVTPVRESPEATPRRRLTSPTTQPGSVEAGRRVDAPRTDRRNIEARRAGEPRRLANDGRQNREQPVRAAEERRSEPRGDRAPAERREAQRPEPRREVERAPARESRPAPQVERAPAREARPERREVSRPSSPPRQAGGGERSSGQEGNRRR